MNNNIALTNALINNEVAEWRKIKDQEEQLKKHPEYNPSDDDKHDPLEVNDMREEQI